MELNKKIMTVHKKRKKHASYNCKFIMVYANEFLKTLETLGSVPLCLFTGLSPCVCLQDVQHLKITET